MKMQRLLIVLTFVNLALTLFLLGQLRPINAESAAPVLRGRGLQIVDERGNIRASIAVLPSTTQRSGERSAETVLLRLITEKGRPSVKIAASEEAAGLALVGPSGTKNTYVQLGASGATSSLTLKNENGQEQVVKP